MAFTNSSLPSNMSFASILDEQFSAPIDNVDYKLLSALKALHSGPNTLHVALLENNFALSAYLLAEGISTEIQNDKPRHELVAWNARAGGGSAAGLFVHPVPMGSTVTADELTEKGELYSNLRIGCMTFRYKDTDFTVYKITWGHNTLYDFVFEAPTDVVRDVNEKSSNQSAGHALITAVYRWNNALKDEMWVYQGGAWAKDKALWAAIRNTSWDDLVLEKGFLDGLRRDTRTFFENREIYQELGVVWKRGLLLLGPPGNGKTESIKVLLKESGQTALYVKSFTTSRGPEVGVRAIFDHARSHAPCILVIEDLDSLVSASVRSFFLNELDGLAQNEGILTIATTNHPEQIDDAILNRPSRFDVKYDFALPTSSLRTTYALKWIRKIVSIGSAPGSSAKKTTVKFERNETDLAAEVAKKTEGWSFAFLKELFISFLLRLAHDRTRAIAQGMPTQGSSGHHPFSDSVLMDQIQVLSKQILTLDTDSEKANMAENTGTGLGVGGYAPRRRLAVRQNLLHPGQNF